MADVNLKVGMTAVQIIALKNKIQAEIARRTGQYNNSASSPLSGQKPDGFIPFVNTPVDGQKSLY